MDFDFQAQVAAKTEQELMDIYVNAGNFQERFVTLAEEELHRRNVPLEHLRQIRTEKQKVADDVLHIGRQGNPVFIGIGFFVALLGGIGAIVAGYIYNKSTHTSGTGDTYYVYNASTRKLGGYMMVIGVLIAIISFFWQVTSFGY